MLGIRTKLTDQEISQLEAVVEKELLARASRAGIRPDTLVVRDILPQTDLNLPTEVWSESVSANGYATVVSSKKLDDDQFLAVFGVKSRSLNPLTCLIRFRTGAGGAKVKDIWNIEPIYTEEEAAGYGATPVYFEKNETFQIDFYAKAEGRDNIILLGKMCEPRGKTVMGGV